MRIRWVKRRSLHIVPAVHDTEEDALPVLDGPFVETKEVSLAGERRSRGFRLGSGKTARASREVVLLSATRKWLRGA
jgi:hypothetical protein